MKFVFCSDGDCPLWALAALHALGSLPAHRFRTILQHVAEEQPDDGIIEILKGTSLSSRAECARALATIRWVLAQAWCSACSSVQLTRDLLVLGLPRAHASAFAEVAAAGRESHVTCASTNGLLVNELVDVSISRGPEEAVDTYKLTLFTDNVLNGKQKRKDFLIDKTQAKSLLAELRKAYKKMDNLEKEQSKKVNAGY